MDGSKVGVLEEGDEVGLGGLLQRHDSGGLEAEVRLEAESVRDRKGEDSEANLKVLRNFADETLEGELADEQLGRLLVTTNFTEGDGAGADTMGLLHAAGRGCCGGLARCGLGGELLTWGLAYRMPSITLINKVGIM